MFLREGAFNVFKGLETEVQNDYTRLKGALMQAFCMDSGAAYEYFKTRSLMAGETVEVYLADITRLGHLVDPELSEKFLTHAFVAGLLTGVKDKIKTSDHLSKLSLGETVARTRVFVSDISTHAAVAGLRNNNSSRPTSQL